MGRAELSHLSHAETDQSDTTSSTERPNSPHSTSRLLAALLLLLSAPLSLNNLPLHPTPPALRHEDHPYIPAWSLYSLSFVLRGLIEDQVALRVDAYERADECPASRDGDAIGVT